MLVRANGDDGEKKWRRGRKNLKKLRDLAEKRDPNRTRRCDTDRWRDGGSAGTLNGFFCDEKARRSMGFCGNTKLREAHRRFPEGRGSLLGRVAPRWRSCVHDEEGGESENERLRSLRTRAPEGRGYARGRELLGRRTSGRAGEETALTQRCRYHESATARLRASGTIHY